MQTRRSGGLAALARCTIWTTSLALAALPTNAANIFTGFYSFGDSLTDSGNVALAAGGAYPSGRFSDGPTWAEYLASDLGLGSHGPSLAAGNNHAWGGAWTANGGAVPSVLQQVGGYTAGSAFQPTDLVSLWAGANDFFGTLMDPGGPQAPSISVGNLGAALDLLGAAGAQYVLVLNLPDLGTTPELAGGPAALAASAWTQGFNSLLSAEIDAKRNSLGITIYEADIYGRAADIQANPTNYGLTNATDPVFPDLTLDSSQTAYWDGIHPTTVVHGIFAQEAANSIPEPGISALAILGIGIFCARRRRS